MSAHAEVPETLAKKIIAVFGERGWLWLEGLPQMLAQCERQFKLKLGQPYEHLSYNYVAPAVLENGRPCVFKMGVPNPDVLTEIGALLHFNTHGAVELLAFDKFLGVLILEQLVPGQRLNTLPDDDKATEIAISLMQTLWRPTQDASNYPSTRRWFSILSEPQYKQCIIPYHLIDAAIGLARDLHASEGECVLLHGDLQHYNILSAERSPWLAIDPKGVVGERECEIAAFMKNPFPFIVTQMETKKILNRRLDMFVDHLGFDRQRLKAWCLAQFILSAVWSLNDSHKEVEYALALYDALV